MGYDLHITRKEFWADEEGPEISVQEWQALIERDPELTRNPAAGEYLAEWSGPSEYPDPWLDYREGNLFSKNPDEPLIEKMVQLARQLNARVQGDDGEIYPEGGQQPNEEQPSPGERAATTAPSNPPRPWWTRLFGN